MTDLVQLFTEATQEVTTHDTSAVVVGINWFFTVLSFLGAFLIGIYTIPNVYRTLKTKSAAHINTIVAAIMMTACFCLATSTIWIVGVTIFGKVNGWNPVTGEVYNAAHPLELTIENMWFPLAMMIADTISFTGNLILLTYKLITVKKQKAKEKLEKQQLNIATQVQLNQIDEKVAGQCQIFENNRIYQPEEEHIEYTIEFDTNEEKDSWLDSQAYGIEPSPN